MNEKTESDRELHEAAAKAAGVCLHPEVTHSYGNWGCDTTCKACGEDPSYARWSPLTDDGDALRLAVKLEIDIFTGESYRMCETDLGVTSEPIGVDPMAATRRAIVRAAAAIAAATEGAV